MSASLLAAILLLDLALGDPHGWPHPIVWIGRLISWLEDWLRETFKNLRLAGILLVVATLSVSGGLAWLLLQFAGAFNEWLLWLVSLWLSWSCLALRSLHSESAAVIRELEAGDLDAARQALSMIVGRETATLSEEGILKATMETVAENASDGVIAPLFYLLLGGPVLAIIFKAVSTLDSMVGYKNERYREFGWAGAKLDDILNYIPARLTGFLFIIFSYPLRMNFQNAKQMMFRDAKKHASPNAGWPEAAAAGALGVQFGGAAVYFGQRLEKPTFGDADEQPTSIHYHRLIRLLYTSTLGAALLAILIQGVL
ncbi:adenosylcobinamide-phosphate synthase [Malonomonas rubra DSM 5091]|uniref:Cobalamin biosynthesis protein CobD n=1 Tax=Malonomonas rubra DSM 5091 TaxID=1122189 RepID=A0A1M6GML1_MALRU|nr:adenosylcobinamide-phosphate synthase CbiB [Malonomonas rubra]SHJ11142.1 adenosylcobinamide-phosphate synthase [Malonomonas rubra DSM 5091]